MTTLPQLDSRHRIYSLDTSCWAGFGGRHYVAKITWYDGANKWHSHELERRLSLKEAKRLWGEDRPVGDTEYYWRLGISRETNRFETRESLEACAVRWVQSHVAQEHIANWLLINGNKRNPNRPIAAAGWLADKWRMDTMRMLARKWDKVDDYTRRTNQPLWDAVFKAWTLCLRPPVTQ